MRRVLFRCLLGNDLLGEIARSGDGEVLDFDVSPSISSGSLPENHPIKDIQLFPPGGKRRNLCIYWRVNLVSSRLLDRAVRERQPTRPAYQLSS